MKKLLIAVVAIALVIWVITWFRAPEAVTKSAARPWPAGMGTLDTVAARYPAQKANDAAVKLTTLGRALPKTAAIEEFVSREISRGELSIGQPPALPDVAPMRELLLRETLVWERGEGIGGDNDIQSRRAMHLAIARALVADALTKARANDAAAWDDLHAVWKLARSLDGHPQMVVQTSAFAMARMINAVAWKLPLPAPAWLAELQQQDHLRPLLEAFQYSASSYTADGLKLFPTKMLANDVEHDRLIVEDLLKETRCDVNMRMNQLGVDLSFVWRRAFRYRAEREATANAMRAREGKPVAPTSRCSDGTWAFDGTTLKFTREIPTAAPDRPMPLALRVK
ncbi:MAG TPA: hypothetical protein VKB93_12585 [Thermoanaerobaculia bacterium]|nr:hypothetical protein [Thermoanaerobaculia bacterium]